MKKFLSCALLASFVFLNTCNLAFCEEQVLSNEQNIVPLNEEVVVDETNNELEKGEVVENTVDFEIKNITTSYKKLNKKEYKRVTVFKHYSPYEVKLKNTSNIPVLMTTKTEIEFITNDNQIIKSDSRRDIYRYTRKKDRGRHYALQVPGVILGTCISFGTFLLGTPIGYGVYKAMQHPTVKAARTNVSISQDLYSDHGLPLRFEPNIEYLLYFYPPKSKNKKNPVVLKTIKIKNVSLNNDSDTRLTDIEIPLIDIFDNSDNDVMEEE